MTGVRSGRIWRLKLSRRVFAIAGAVLLMLGIVGYAYRRPLGYFALFHLGRCPACTRDDISRALNGDSDRIEKFKTDLAASCRIIRQDAEGYELWSTPSGDFWIPPENSNMLQWLLLKAEQRIYQLKLCKVSHGDIVLDCGAHIGVFTKQFLSSGAERVVAIEPSPENLTCLRRNLAKEVETGRVIIYPKGLWDKETILEFETIPEFSAGDRVAIEEQKDSAVQQIAVTTIDHLVAELELDHVDFIKMNIEGSEQPALLGAQATISKFHPKLVIAAHHKDDDAQRIPELVRAAWAGYSMRGGSCYVDLGRFLIRPDMLFFFE